MYLMIQLPVEQSGGIKIASFPFDFSKIFLKSGSTGLFHNTERETRNELPSLQMSATFEVSAIVAPER